MKKLARKLIDDSKKYNYVRGGKRRIFNSIERLKKLTSGNEKLLDIGGHPHLGHGYSFEEYITMVCDVSYEWVGCSKLDMRTDKLPYEDDSFDLVISWETIEHLWLMKRGGMLSWEGIFNFWRESHRVLKPGGIFFVATRNRLCPLAMRQAMVGNTVQVGASNIDESGHVRELSPNEFREIAKHTKLFTKNSIESKSSVPAETQKNLNEWTPHLETFLKRPLKEEEKYDTIYFISKKPKDLLSYMI